MAGQDDTLKLTAVVESNSTEFVRALGEASKALVDLGKFVASTVKELRELGVIDTRPVEQGLRDASKAAEDVETAAGGATAAAAGLSEARADGLSGSLSEAASEAGNVESGLAEAASQGEELGSQEWPRLGGALSEAVDKSGEVADGLETAGERAEDLGDQALAHLLDAMQAGGDDTEALDKALAAAIATAEALGDEAPDELVEAIRAAEEQAGSLRGGLGEAQGAAEQLGGMSLRGLVAELGAATREVREFARETAQAVADVSKKVAMGTAAAATAIGGTLGLAAKGAATVDKKFAEVITLLNNVPMQRIEELRVGADSIAEKFGQDVVVALQGMYDAISAGVEEAKVLGFLEEAAVGAIGGVSDLSTAVDLGTSVLNAYGQGAEHLGDVMDTTFVTVLRGKTTFDEIARSIGQVAPLAAANGVSFQELGAALATTTAGGIRTAQSVSGLKAALANIAKPSGVAIKLAEELGLQFDGAALRSKGLGRFMNDLVRDIQRSGADTTQVLTDLFGSVEAANVVLTLTSGGAATFNANLAAMSERAGAAAGAFETIRQNDPTFVFNQIAASASRVRTQVGRLVLEATDSLAVSIEGVLKDTTKWISENEELVRILVQAGIAATVLLTGIAAVAGGIALLSLAVASLMAVGLPLILAVSVIVLPAILAVVAVLGVLYLAWDEIVAFAKAEMPELLELARSAFAGIVAAAQPLIAQIKDRLLELVRAGLAWLREQMPAIRAMLAQFFDWVARVAIPAVGKAMLWVLDRLDWLGKFFVKVWPSAVQTFRAAWDVVVALFELGRQVLLLVWDALKAIWGEFDTGNAEGPAKWARRFHVALQAVLGTIRFIVDAIADLVAGLREVVRIVNEGDFRALAGLALKASSSPFGILGAIASVGGDKSDSIPAMAAGGIVDGATLAMIGEAGPEAVIPLAQGAVPVAFNGGSLADAIASALRGSMSGLAAAGTGGPTIQVYQQPGEDGMTLARRICDAVRLAQGS